MAYHPTDGHSLLQDTNWVERLTINVCLFFLIVFYYLGMDPSLEDTYNNITIPLEMTEWNIHDPSRLIATGGLLIIAADGKENTDGYR